MFRLGIIGSDNSHAVQFSKLVNLEDGIDGNRIEDAQVTHIYGTDPERTKQVAEEGNIPNVVNNMEEMLGAVDGALVLWRHGSKHYAETLPFIKAGIPVFVDKPLTADVAQARELITAAQQAGVGLTSFSTLRFARETVAFLEELKANLGPLGAGVVTGPADPDSEYDGIFFYGIHGVELMNAAFGYGAQRVTATRHANAVHAACAFESGALVTLNFIIKGPYLFHIMAFGEKAWREYALDSKTYYYDGMQVIMNTLRTGQWPLTAEQLLEPVQTLAAIQRSLAENRAVALSEVG